MSSPESLPKPEIPKRESELHKEAILRRLNLKIETLLELDDLFLSVKADEPLNETQKKIDNFLLNITNRLSTEEVDKINLLKKKRLATDRAERIMPFLKDKGEIFRHLTEEEREEVIKDQEQVTEDEMLVLDISSIINNFLNNRRIVLELSNEQIRQEINKLFPGSGIEHHPLEIRRGIYDIQILLDKDILKKIYSSGDYDYSTLYGFHRNNTPYSFIRHSYASREEESVKHERVHTLLDGAQFLKSVNPYNLIRGEYKFYNQLFTGTGKARQFFSERFSPERVVSMVHNEIIAALENLSTEEEWYSRVSTVSESEEKKLSAHMFESASAQILETVAFLEEHHRITQHDEDFANLSKELAVGMRDMFIRVTNIIRESRAVAKKLAAMLQGVFTCYSTYYAQAVIGT